MKEEGVSVCVCVGACVRGRGTWLGIGYGFGVDVHCRSVADVSLEEAHLSEANSYTSQYLTGEE